MSWTVGGGARAHESTTNDPYNYPLPTTDTEKRTNLYANIISYSRIVYRIRKNKRSQPSIGRQCPSSSRKWRRGRGRRREGEGVGVLEKGKGNGKGEEKEMEKERKSDEGKGKGRECED